jgi:hypothetical protein
MQTLYAYDNKIPMMTGLEKCKFVTHLYLQARAWRIPAAVVMTARLSRMCGSMQNNAISRIEGISHLNLLEKLYVGGNRITLIDTLEFCPRCAAYPPHSPLEIAWTRVPQLALRCLGRAMLLQVLEGSRVR